MNEYNTSDEDTQADEAASEQEEISTITQPVPYSYLQQNQYRQYSPYPYPPQYPYPQQYGYPPQYPYPQQYPYPPQYVYPPQQVYTVMQPMGYIYQPGVSQPVKPPLHRRKPSNSRSNSRRYGQLNMKHSASEDASFAEEQKKSALPITDIPVTYTPQPEPAEQPEPVSESAQAPQSEPEPDFIPSRFNKHRPSDSVIFDVVDVSGFGGNGDNSSEKPRFNKRNHLSQSSQESAPLGSETASDDAERPKFNKRSRG